MNELDRFHIDIYKLSNSRHEYDFTFDNNFFIEQEESLIEKGSGDIHIILDKNESFIKMAISINGQVELICDRSLDPFDFNIEIDRSIIFKYGEEEKELDDDVIMITRDTQRLNLAQYVYEFIGLEIPMKKLHPRFENDNTDDELVYSDMDQKRDDNDADTDPRWETLKKLKGNN